MANTNAEVKITVKDSGGVELNYEPTLRNAPVIEQSVKSLFEQAALFPALQPGDHYQITIDVKLTDPKPAV
jgi:hypothetical protein